MSAKTTFVDDQGNVTRTCSKCRLTLPLDNTTQVWVSPASMARGRAVRPIMSCGVLWFPASAAPSCPAEPEPQQEGGDDGSHREA